jgi:hypothetical protein
MKGPVYLRGAFPIRPDSDLSQAEVLQQKVRVLLRTNPEIGGLEHGSRRQKRHSEG